MSLTTWKKEFYPSPADRIKTVKGAIEHSLRKWKGLLKNNLKKHKVCVDEWQTLHSIRSNFSYDDLTDWLEINADSCALCLMHHIDCKLDCENCPLNKYTGDDCKKTYNHWVDKEDPLPMIRALEKCLKDYKSGKKKTR